MRVTVRTALRGVVASLTLVSILSCGEERATGVEPLTRVSGPAPRLVQCPTDQTQRTQAVVGLLGGTVQLGATAIRIPPGALTVPTLITLTVPASKYVEIEVQAEDFTSFLFQQPVSISIDYSRCRHSAVLRHTLTAWQIDPLTKALLEKQTSRDDKASRTVTFTTGHLSGYAVAF